MKNAWTHIFSYKSLDKHVKFPVVGENKDQPHEQVRQRLLKCNVYTLGNKYLILQLNRLNKS